MEIDKCNIFIGLLYNRHTCASAAKEEMTKIKKDKDDGRVITELGSNSSTFSYE